MVAGKRLAGGWRRLADLLLRYRRPDERRVEITIRPDEVTSDGGLLTWRIPLPRVEVAANARAIYYFNKMRNRIQQAEKFS